jgi:50S ribosomal protein L16 3-hydroxylase
MNKDSFTVTAFEIDSFLQEFWQKKPCVIKGFFSDFDDPLDEHELAGLAQEEEVDSRLVSKHDNQWQVTQGPIDDFAPLCVGAWSLLVQGVDRYVPEVDAMFAAVGRMGNWRMDDVMVSFSTAGAGVGAHVDQYDVFIVQGKGSRRWQVGLPSEHETRVPHPLLSQIEAFDAVIDQVLMPGDAIYIPPLHPHSGVTLEACLNYSIGFRAPTNVELLHGLLDEGDGLHLAQRRYSDPDCAQYRDVGLSAHVVTKEEIGRLKQSVIGLLDSPEAEQALMRFISRQALPDARPEQPYDIAAVIDAINSECDIVLLPGIKPIYLQQSAENFVFYIDGEPFSVIAEIKALIQGLLDNKTLACPIDINETALKHLSTLVLQMLNAGYIDIQ